MEKYLDTEILDGRNLAVSPNALEGGSTYKFICNGWRTKKTGTSGQSFEMRTVNLPPKGGTCTISPKSGLAMNTSFTIACKDWSDVDLPLTYKYGVVKGKKYDAFFLIIRTVNR